MIKAWRVIAIPRVIYNLKKEIANSVNNSSYGGDQTSPSPSSGFTFEGEEEQILTAKSTSRKSSSFIHDNGKNDEEDDCGIEHDVKFMEKRKDILLSMDAILNRASIPFFNAHDTIIQDGGIEVMMELLNRYGHDQDMVHFIFQILVTFMYEDGKRVKIHRRSTSSSFKMNNTNDCHRDEENDELLWIHGHIYRNKISNSTSTKNRWRKRTNKSRDYYYRTAKRIHFINGGKDLIYKLVNHYQHIHDDIRILGKSIMKDLIKAESIVAFDVLSDIKEAVRVRVPYITYTTINPNISNMGIFNHESTSTMSQNIKPTATKQHDLTAKNTIHHALVMEQVYQQDIPGVSALDAVVENMLKFSLQEKIQLVGLEIMLKCLEIEHSVSPRQDGHIVNMNGLSPSCSRLIEHSDCSRTLISLLQLNMTNMTSTKVVWRTHAVLMKLTMYVEFCTHFDIHGGCKTILDNLASGKNESVGIQQMKLWSLVNLCKVDRCKHNLIGLELKSVLYQLIQDSRRKEENSGASRNCYVPVPLLLKTLFPLSELEAASRFKETRELPIEITKGYNCLHLLSNSVKNPSHGTINNLFENGVNGLV